MIKSILIFLFFIVPLAILNSQNSSKTADLTIEVRSNHRNDPIAGAIVDIKGYGDTVTGSDGKAVFMSIPYNSYRYSIDANGYIFYFPDNTIKVTEGVNHNYASLSPAPSDLFFVNGKVVNNNNEPMNDVNVLFQSVSGIPMLKRTTTDEWGYYAFAFENNEIELNTIFSIDFKKEGYQFNSEKERVFSKNQIRLPAIRILKKKQ